MKGLRGTLVALAFTLFALITLLSENRNWQSSLVPVAGAEAKVSELGLRFRMQP
jgi:hypothetical protein